MYKHVKNWLTERKRQLSDITLKLAVRASGSRTFGAVASALVVMGFLTLALGSVAYAQPPNNPGVTTAATRAVQKAADWLQTMFYLAGPLYGGAGALWAMRHQQPVKQHVGFGAGSVGIGLMIDAARNWTG